MSIGESAMTVTRPHTLETVLKSLEEKPELLRNNWCVPRETGRFLRVMALTLSAKRICEVGTSIGYSTLWLASAAYDTAGQVDTIEYFEERQNQAKANLNAANLCNVVNFHLGPAIEVLQRFQQEQREFDLAFIDAAKKEYIDYAKLLERMLVPGGILIADNTQSHREEMQDFLSYMEDSERFEIAEIQTPNGQLIAWKQ
jgi:predicted O-methyltransferase YrrM